MYTKSFKKIITFFFYWCNFRQLEYWISNCLNKEVSLKNINVFKIEFFHSENNNFQKNQSQFYLMFEFKMNFKHCNGMRYKKVYWALKL